MTSLHYYSRGKLLISGEYLVLLGALALAIPVRFGQHMHITGAISKGVLPWNTLVCNKPWFDAEFSIPGPSINTCSDAKPAAYVQQVLLAAQRMNPGFLTDNAGCRVECRIDFDIQWGLGSSSSLISNIAWWAGVDHLELHSQVSKGSGYDVVCARSSKPILFEIVDEEKRFAEIDFMPPFAASLYFIYLGKKMDSQADVEVFMKSSGNYRHEIEQISSISRQMAECKSAEEFGNLMREHENIMASVLKRPGLKASSFRDFPGEIKSLGAWGGDFAMALWPHGKKELENYLASKNLRVYFGLNEMMYDLNEQEQQ